MAGYIGCVSAKYFGCILFGGLIIDVHALLMKTEGLEEEGPQKNMSAEKEKEMRNYWYFLYLMSYDRIEPLLKLEINHTN